MTLPDIELTPDSRGLPALKIEDIVLPLTMTLNDPVTDEMAESLLDRLRADYADQLPDSWATQSVWDQALSLQPVQSPIDRVGRLALSLYGWRAGAAAANQSPASWLANQQSGVKSRPGAKPEPVWSILEGRATDDLRVVGVIGHQSGARQVWQKLDRNQPAGSRGGHQQIWTDNLAEELDDAIKELGQLAPVALWLRPNDQNWFSLAAKWRPALLIDPYPLAEEACWRRLKLELTGRRLATTVWMTDELLGGDVADGDLAHGVAWQIQRYSTLSDLLALWSEATAAGWLSMLIEPETVAHSAWLTDLADVLKAEYVWFNRP